MEDLVLRDKIRALLPKETIGRYDLLPIFQDIVLFGQIIEFLAAPYRGRVDYVASPEAIGWILGAGIARELGVGFIPIRKAGKLPYPNEMLISCAYTDYTKSKKTLEMRRHMLPEGKNVLIADEWIETGNTMSCCIELIEKSGSSVVGIATIGLDYEGKPKKWVDSGFAVCIGKDM